MWVGVAAHHAPCSTFFGSLMRMRYDNKLSIESKPNTSNHSNFTFFAAFFHFLFASTFSTVAPTFVHFLNGGFFLFG